MAILPLRIPPCIILPSISGPCNDSFRAAMAFFSALFTSMMHHRYTAVFLRSSNAQWNPTYNMQIPRISVRTRGSTSREPDRFYKPGGPRSISPDNAWHSDRADPEARNISTTVLSMALCRKTSHTRSQTKNGRTDKSFDPRRLRLRLHCGVSSYYVHPLRAG